MAANKGPRNATPIKASRQKPERVRRVAGAHSARTSLQDRFRSWRQHHQDSFKDALQRLNAARTSSAMTILVIAIALALPAGLAVLLDNARAITRGWDGNAHLSVFMEMNISEQRQRDLASDWQGLDNISRTEVITREQALAEFKALSGFGDVLEALPAAAADCGLPGRDRPGHPARPGKPPGGGRRGGSGTAGCGMGTPPACPD